jgi:hypothetical protein
MTVKVVIETGFINLTPREQQAYREIRTQIGAILTQQDGLEMVLNALVANGSVSTVDEIGRWIKGVEGIDSRDLAALCYGPGRIVTVESTIVDS